MGHHKLFGFAKIELAVIAVGPCDRALYRPLRAVNYIIKHMDVTVTLEAKGGQF